MTTDTTPAPVTSPVGLVPRVAAAWADHDAETFADLFTEDGTMTLPGYFLQGREHIRQFLRRAFTGPYQGTRVVGTPMEVRELGESCTLVHTVGGVVRAGESTLAPQNEVNALWVVVRDDHGWRLAAYQNSPRHRT